MKKKEKKTNEKRSIKKNRKHGDLYTCFSWSELVFLLEWWEKNGFIFFFLFQLQYDSVPEEHWCGSNRPRKEVKNRITRFELKKGPSFEINVPIRKGLIVNHCLYIQPDGTWDCNDLSPRKRNAKYFLTFLSLFNQGGCWTMARKQLFWFWHFFRQWLLY